MGSDSARKVWSATAENNIQGHFGFQDTGFLTSVALPRRKSSKGVSIFEKLKRVWRDKEQKSAFKKIKFIYFKKYFGSTQGMWDLSSPIGIEPVPPVLEAQCLNHWTRREVPRRVLFIIVSLCVKKCLSLKHISSVFHPLAPQEVTSLFKPTLSGL